MNTIYCYSLLVILAAIIVLGGIYAAPRCHAKSPSIIIGGVLLAGCQ